MSSDNFIQWPKGINTNWSIVQVPNFPLSLARDCLSFICGNCIFYNKSGCKSRPFIGGIDPSPSIVSRPIVLETLFKDALEGGTDNEALRDFFRYQSHPSRQQSLMKHPAFARLVALTQSAIDQRVRNYVVHKCSILYSLPHGPQQGLHIDDIRSNEDIDRQGELLSVVLALQDNTKLDIANDKGERQTFQIPFGSMFLLSGTCLHGGASFLSNNCRVHLTFVKKEFNKNIDKDNGISLVYTCPDKDCAYNSGDMAKTVTLVQLQDHWKFVHRKKHGLTLKQFKKILEGSDIYTCQKCGKRFCNTRSFHHHLKVTCHASANDNIEE
mmetsp:Transcript_10026/g.18798  ORF Transcript_10026/g.18798 Transcript_10026/m.18798 type:complete len:326 (+) Transcript_10026:119-1096(+)